MAFIMNKLFLMLFLLSVTPILAEAHLETEPNIPLSYWTCDSCEVKAPGNPPDGEFTFVGTEPFPNHFSDGQAKYCYFIHGQYIIITGKPPHEECPDAMGYFHFFENSPSSFKGQSTIKFDN